MQALGKIALWQRSAEGSGGVKVFVLAAITSNGFTCALNNTRTCKVLPGSFWVTDPFTDPEIPVRFRSQIHLCNPRALLWIRGFCRGRSQGDPRFFHVGYELEMENIPGSFWFIKELVGSWMRKE